LWPDLRLKSYRLVRNFAPPFPKKWVRDGNIKLKNFPERLPSRPLESSIQTYTELRQQIHRDLRIQHPEWVEPNGESPMCDFNEARLMELLHADAKGLS